MKVLLLLAKGFETMEASAFIDVLGWSRNGSPEDVQVVTCGFQKQLAAFGAEIAHDPIVIDRNIITSYGPTTAPHVAFTLLEKLTSPEAAMKVKISMGYL